MNIRQRKLIQSLLAAIVFLLCSLHSSAEDQSKIAIGSGTVVLGVWSLDSFTDSPTENYSIRPSRICRSSMTMTNVRKAPASSISRPAP